jgi:PAS domain S-box-containing protein
MRIYAIGAQSRPDEAICDGLRDQEIDITVCDVVFDPAQFLSFPPDAILFEISQPNFDMALFREVRERYVDLPIVVLSVQPGRANAVAFIREGAQDYFVKEASCTKALSRCLTFAIERNRLVLLQQSAETRMREVLEHAYDGFITTDSELRITQWNAAAERTFGWKKEEMLGRCLSHIVPHHLQRQFLHKIELYFQKKDSSFLRPSREILGERWGGETFPAEFGIFKIDKDSDCVYCAFVRDISTFKKSHEKLEHLVHERTERLTRSNDSLYQFAKIASHDLQEPLRAVEGFAYLLSDAASGKLDPDCTEFIGFILDGVKRMKELVQSILIHSRVDRDQTVEQCTDCNSIVSQILTDIRPLIDETDTSFEIDTLPQVAVEHSQLIQLFQNLIANSIKYRSASPPSISISATKTMKQWLFAITDNGIGIDPQYSDQVFDMFSRLHSKGQYSGTGIGLAICKKIVSSYGGKIWIESSLGQGATFMFTLPAVKEKRNQKVMKEKIEILLAEDTPSDVRLTQEALKRSSLSYELTVVNDGVEALEYLAKAKASPSGKLPDIILLDLNMPRKNGHAVLEGIKNDPILRPIPVVLLTVSESDEDVLEALGSKMNYYLAKPVTTEKLFSLVKSIHDLHTEIEDRDVAYTKEEDHIRLVLAGNPHTSLVALSRLANDPQERVRARVAENPRTPEELQLKLAGDALPDVRARLAENINVAPSVLELLAKDENADVRLAATSSPGIPIGALQALSHDDNVYVCASAKRMLAETV